MEFSAAHRLWRPEWDEARNRAAYGAAASPLGHGHNYDLEVTIRGGIDPETGMVIDLKRLDDVMRAEVETRFDHASLGESEHFRDRPETAENLAQTIFELLDRALPQGLLHRVRLSPTPDLCVEVTR